MKKKMINLLYGVVLFYLFLLAALYFFQRNMMYFPAGQRPSPESMGIAKPIEVDVTTSDNITITGWYWPADNEDTYTVIHFHGNAQEYLARMQKSAGFYNEGYGFLFAEYRGFGGNDGKPSEQGFYADARAYIDYLVDQGIPLDRIVVYGESIGTGVTVQMAREYDVAAIMLESPFTTIPDVARATHWMFPLDLLMKDQYRNIDKIAYIKMPKFIVHGSADELVPLSMAQRLYDASKEPKQITVLDGATHYDMHVHGSVQEMVGFLRRLKNSDSIEP